VSPCESELLNSWSSPCIDLIVVLVFAARVLETFEATLAIHGIPIAHQLFLFELSEGVSFI